MIIKLILFFNFLLIFNSSYAKKNYNNDSIAIFNWWDFIIPKVQKKINDQGYKFNIIEYRSNEVALSKLLSPQADYDIVIVSNWVLQILKDANYLNPLFNQTILKSRDYIPFLEKMGHGCIPYMWSTTTFAIDTLDIKLQPNTIFSLIELKKKGIKIGLIDDPIEFATRVIMDNKKSCKNDKKLFNPLDINEQCAMELEKLNKDLEPKDFRNTIEKFLDINTAVYAWHGEVGSKLDSHPNLNFVLPQSDIILGADYVCIPKKKRYKPNLKKFVEFLTNKENTEIQVNELQYFSPYNHHEVQQHPKITKLKTDILERVKTSPPIFLSAPQPESHSRINKWWQSIRYGKQK